LLKGSKKNFTGKKKKKRKRSNKKSNQKTLTLEPWTQKKEHKAIKLTKSKTRKSKFKVWSK
jgi:hypothetical protein